MATTKRYDVKDLALAPEGVRRTEPAEVVDPTRVMVAHPLVIAADATRSRTGLRPHSA